jgi:site-specific DNA-methyltransferase (adenine-specific)
MTPQKEGTTNAILHGDCREVLRGIPSRTVDFALTDPPYAARYLDRSGRRVEGDTSGEWMQPAFAEVYRVLKPDSYFVSFYGWPRAADFLRSWRDAGFRIGGHFVWSKEYASSAGLVRYHHEQAYLLVKGGPERPAVILPDVLPWHYTGNRLHPTQKPLSALGPLIVAFSRRGDVVLDPFCGSGSALVAARLLGRRYLGVEIDAPHAATASERLQRMRS